MEDELNMVDSVHEELLSTFMKEAEELAKSRGLKPKKDEIITPLEAEVSTEEVIGDDVEMSKDIKKLYRKIVTKTHPDKLIGVEEDVKLKLTNLFELAVEAVENKDLLQLISVADELGIPNITIDETHIPIIKHKVSILDDRLKKSKDSTVYVWYSSDEETKKNILEKYLTFMYF